MKSGSEKIVLIVAIILFISVIPLRAAERDSAFRFPVRAYNDGNYRVALRGFNQFIENFPDDERIPRLLFWKGEAYRHLEESDRAYDSFLDLHHEYPEFEKGKVILRLAYLAEELDRREEVRELITPRLLQEVPALQNYLIKWLYREDKEEEIFSRLSVLPPGSLSELSRSFLGHFRKDRDFTDLEEKLASGRWTPDIWEQMRKMTPATRENLILLGARRIWEKEKYDRLLTFARRVPENWHSTEFSLYRAEAAVRKNNYDLAESVYRKILDSSAYREEIHFSLGWVLYKQDKLNEALKILESLRWEQESELSARARRLLADIRLIENDQARAQEHYLRAIEFSGDTVFINQTRYWLGWSYFEADMIHEAYETFHRVQAEEPIKLVDIYQVRGRTALELGKYNEAEDYYQRALEYSDDSRRETEISYELAQAYYESGRVKTAFDILLKLNREALPYQLQAPVRLGLGRSALEVGRSELAWSVFRSNEEQLLKDFPVEFRFFAGQAAMEVKLPERSLSYFNELIEQYPNSPFVRPALRMSFRVELKKLAAGEEQYAEKIREKINRSPVDMRISMLQDWAEVEQRLERPEEALTIYEEVLLKTTEPSLQARVINKMVEIYMDQKQSARASRFLKKQLDQLPDHPAAAEAVYRLIAHDYRNKNISRLQNWLERYTNHFDRSPYDGNVYFIKAELYRNEKNNERAAKFYRQSLEFAESDFLQTRARFRLGQLQLKLSDYQAAYDNLVEVLDRQPDFIDSDILNEMLADAALGFENYQLVEKHLNRLTTLKDRHRLLEARVFYQKGDLAQARQLLQQLDLPEDSLLLAEKKFWQGRIAAETEDYERAEELWYQVLYLYPEFDGREDLIFRLATLQKNLGNDGEAESLKETLEEEFPESDYLEVL